MTVHTIASRETRKGKSMEYSFMTPLAAELTKKGFEIEARHVKKLNDEYYGLEVRREGDSVGRLFPIDAIKCRLGKRSILQVAEEIAEILENDPHGNADFLFEKLGEMKLEPESFLVAVVNTEKNQELLSNIPHRELCDLSVYLRIDLGDGTVVLNDKVANHIGIIDPKRFLEDMIPRIAEVRQAYVMPFNPPDLWFAYAGAAPDTDNVYEVVNKEKCYGAGILAYPGFLENTAERLGGAFWILPSSVHELLLVPDKSPIANPIELFNMVTDINHNEVDPRDRLSDNVYRYNPVSKTLVDFAGRVALYD